MTHNDLLISNREYIKLAKAVARNKRIKIKHQEYLTNEQMEELSNTIEEDVKRMKELLEEGID